MPPPRKNKVTKEDTKKATPEQERMFRESGAVNQLTTYRTKYGNKESGTLGGIPDIDPEDRPGVVYRNIVPRINDYKGKNTPRSGKDPFKKGKK